ncbi:MAG TPA: FimB/Mfa2 family fimbrial subunit [Candidatus Coprenecus stercoravium]|uniref:FimB/Mfa2 family fimbrial subunit n=1 Tax=Candidatus Coprenecus stercoravium TaxID=2840735 RepID=A0A9D2KA41_9BACT|nr:FimB/Mfa2 family fimbrial subunit [Candidatus Coprenecus stercoravium]
MKKTAVHIISCILVCLSAALLISCQKQVSEVQTGTVSLSIGLSGSLDVEDGPWTKAYVDASQYEGIKTLRLIVISGTPDQEDRDILYNQKVEGFENVSSYQTTIPDLPLGQMSFYAIANEESIGMTYDDKTILDNLIDGPENAGRRKLLFKDENRQYFPCTGRHIVDNGLPMSGYTTVNITGDQNIKIELFRSVVKLALVVENKTKSSVTLEKVSFGEFFADRYYMFRETTLDVPDSALYDGKEYYYPDIEEIQPGGRTETLALYFYPTFPSDVSTSYSPFTLGLETTEVDYGQVLFAPNTNSFVRNTQINLRAQITTTVGIVLDFTVKPWDPYDVDVPSFK